MCGYVVKRMCSPCNGRPVAQAPRTAIGSKEPDVWIHEPTSPHCGRLDGWSWLDGWLGGKYMCDYPTPHHIGG